MITALLERGADPVRPNARDYTAIMLHMTKRHFSCVRRLLRVLSPPISTTPLFTSARCPRHSQRSVPRRTWWYGGFKALHFAADHSGSVDEEMVELLLRAGVDATIRDKRGRTVLDMVEYNEWRFKGCCCAGESLRQVPAAELAVLLVKARRLVILGAGGRALLQAPDCPIDRLKKGKASPRVEMVMCVAEGSKNGGDGSEAHQEQEQHEHEQHQRLQEAMAFLLGLGGPGGRMLPGRVFVRVVDFVMPKWDPLRVGNAGLETEEPADMEAMRREIEETAWR